MTLIEKRDGLVESKYQYYKVRINIMLETYDNTLQTILDNLNIDHTVLGELLDLHFNESITPGLLRAFFAKYDIENLPYQCVWLASKLASKLHYKGIPGEQFPRIKGIIKKFTVKNGMALCKLSGILGAFNENKVDAMLLNGTAMKVFYEPEETRYRSNIDILVHPEDTKKAQVLLEEQGFRLRKTAWRQHEYVKSDVKVVVQTVYLRSNILTGDCAAIWQNSLEISWRGKKAFVPCPEMLLLILLVQGLEASCSRICNGLDNHFVNCFLDIKFFLKAFPFNWDKFLRIVKKSGLTLHTHLMLDVINHLYPDQVRRELSGTVTFTDHDIANVQKLISYNVAKKRMADARIHRNRKEYYLNRGVSLWNMNCYYGNRDSVFSNIIDFPQFISVWNNNRGIIVLLSKFKGVKRMKVSVIIPCFNAGAYLAQAVSSVREQRVSYPLTMEIIVIDDGSTDGCVERLKASPDLIVLCQSHQGAAAARNYGMRKAKGDWLLFLDADDVLMPGSIESLYKGILQNEGSVVALGMAKEFISEELDAKTAVRLPKKETPFGAFLSGCCFGKKEALLKVGFFDTGLNQAGETVDWLVRLRNSGVQMVQLDVVTVRRRIHLTNTGRVCAKEEMQAYATIIRRRLLAQKMRKN